MNKLASIEFLQKIGLPTVNPQILWFKDERKVRKDINSFYRPNSVGWVLRCAEPPKYDGKVERNLPWDMAMSEEELVSKVLSFQRKIGSNYVVFCHPVYEMIRGAIILTDGDRVVVESAEGGPRELSAFYRGKRSPQQQVVFKPGMYSNERYGENILSDSELFDFRQTQRTIVWDTLGKLEDPVVIETSWLKNGRLYVHDVSIFT